MPLEDKVARRRVEHECSKHDLDFSSCTVAVINKVAYFSGRIKPIRGLAPAGETKSRMHKIGEACLTIPGVKEVVFDCQFE
ncbi:MAG TPA: hypothetical protein VGM19_14935 [Armatimonadota bacterium]